MRQGEIGFQEEGGHREAWEERGRSVRGYTQGTERGEGSEAEGGGHDEGCGSVTRGRRAREEGNRAEIRRKGEGGRRLRSWASPGQLPLLGNIVPLPRPSLDPSEQPPTRVWHKMHGAHKCPRRGLIAAAREARIPFSSPSNAQRYFPPSLRRVSLSRAMPRFGGGRTRPVRFSPRSAE